jgi:quinol monooxygenase YgiN
MSEQVYWILALKMKAEKVESFKTLIEEMVASTEANEPNTLNYEYSFSSDDERCHIFERYTDSAAAMTHLTNFGEKFAERFLPKVEVLSLTVYGRPNEDVVEALAVFNPSYLRPAAGFAR